MKVVRATDQPRVRWRNDGGWTRDIARGSPDEHGFSWRISIADVEVDGPFSVFEGCERLLVLLDGPGMDLVRVDGAEPMRLRPGAPRARFAGEDVITAELLRGPTADFNVIWDRSRFWLLECDDWSDTALGGLPGSVVVVHVLSGALATAGGIRGAAGETMIDESGQAIRLLGEGEAIVVVLNPLVDANQAD
jgi:uncharacterized protein